MHATDASRPALPASPGHRPAGFLAVAVSTAAAPAAATAGIPDSTQPGPKTFKTGQVLVKFRSDAGSARVAAAQAQTPVLSNLRLARLVGPHQATQVLSTGAAASLAGPGGRVSSSVPSDALMVFTITDGSSVQDTLAQLRTNPGKSGGCGREQAGGSSGGCGNGCVPPDILLAVLAASVALQAPVRCAPACHVGHCCVIAIPACMARMRFVHHHLTSCKPLRPLVTRSPTFTALPP